MNIAQYTKVRVKQPIACSTLLLSINLTSGVLGSFDANWCVTFYFPGAGLSTRKQNKGGQKCIRKLP